MKKITNIPCRLHCDLDS